jgi:hypothetical protein
VIEQPRRWKADTIAWALGKTITERMALKLTTIGAIHSNPEERSKQELQRHSKHRRAPTAKILDHTLSLPRSQPTGHKIH